MRRVSSIRCVFVHQPEVAARAVTGHRQVDVLTCPRTNGGKKRKQQPQHPAASSLDKTAFASKQHTRWLRLTGYT